MEGSQTVLEAFAIRSIFIDDSRKPQQHLSFTVTLYPRAHKKVPIFHETFYLRAHHKMPDYLVSRFGKVLNNYLHTSGDSQEHNIFQATVTLTYSLPLRQINHSFLAIGFFQLLSKPYHEAEAHVTDRGKLMKNGEHDHTF